jgi:prolyl-tRNA editing enzyme YbaK/EbsC (Cys-tRNA(Pro) deacylase)
MRILQVSQRRRDLGHPTCGHPEPFGLLYDMHVYADLNLAENEEIAFSAGMHRELVRMRCEDLLRLVNPTVDELTYQRRIVAVA